MEMVECAVALPPAPAAAAAAAPSLPPLVEAGVEKDRIAGTLDAADDAVPDDEGNIQTTELCLGYRVMFILNGLHAVKLLIPSILSRGNEEKKYVYIGCLLDIGIIDAVELS